MTKFELFKSWDVYEFAKLLICDMEMDEVIGGNVTTITYWHTWDGFNFFDYRDAYDHALEWLNSGREVVC